MVRPSNDGVHLETPQAQTYSQHQERLQGHRCSSGAALNERPPYWVITSKSMDRRSKQTIGRYLPPWIQENLRRKLTPDMLAPSRWNACLSCKSTCPGPP